MAAAKRTGRRAAPPVVPAEERKAKLERIVRNRTREARAEVRAQGEFTTLLMGGQPISHRLHGLAAIGATAIGAAAGRYLMGDAGLAVGLATGAAYGLFWAFLVVTGGRWFDELTVDEQGVVNSELSGHPPGTRSNFLKVAIPVALIAYCSFLVLALSHDLIFPPPPHCNLTPATEEACLLLPNLADALNPITPSPGPSVSPDPSVSPAPPATHGKPLSRADAIALERIVRGFQLFFSSLVLLVATWFLRRMLTGQWVVAIAPVRHLED
jgi:hypothetical protein